MNAQEKTFLDAVVRKYVEPTPSDRQSTLTVMDAAYFVAKELGNPIPPGDKEIREFFSSFMNGLMEKSEAQKYIDERIQEYISQAEIREQNKQIQMAHAEATMRVLMQTISESALKIRSLSQYGDQQYFAEYSQEWEAIKRIAGKLGVVI